MSFIQVEHLTFAYDGSYDNVFEDVSFRVDTDWRLGFIGRNGKGKTTFLRLLTGEYPYGGRVSASVGFEYFPYAVPDKTLLTLHALQEVDPALEEWRLCRELHGLEADEELLYRPFETLSNGEQTKALLAALFLRENRFLLIDEPTNHLDRGAREAIGRYLSSKKGFILVSHDRKLLDCCADHILSINRNSIEIQKGNFSSWYENRQRREQFEQTRNIQLKREIQSLQKAAQRTKGWSDEVEKSKKGNADASAFLDRGYIGHQAAKMMKRSKAIAQRRQAAIEEKAGLLRDVEETEQLKISPLRHPRQLLVEGRDIAIRYGGREVFSGLSFEIRQGDRLCLAGKNGCGKSSLLKLLLGEPVDYSGELQRASGLKISYVPQDTSFLKGSLSYFIEARGLEESLFKAILRKLDFSREQFGKDLSDYSEGQKKKALIAASLCERAHLYIWDEPLNFVDIFSRVQVEELLQTCGPTLVFVEHDETFQEKIATSLLEFSPRG